VAESRYIRQEIFEPIGAEGQRRLGAASAVVVGCGALGTNIANNLARSGLGRIRIVDRDFVELDNLQRQVLFDEGHVARRLPKAVAAAERLREINSTVALEARVAEVSAANVEALIAGADLVLDGSDNVELRLLLNDACLSARVPYVFGGAVGATGMAMAVVAGSTPCLRCLLGEVPEPGTTPTAATAGILHSTTAIVASVQCSLAVRLLVGAFEPSDEVVCVDAWEPECVRMRVPRRPDCPACGTRRYEFLDARPEPCAAAVPGTSSVRLPAREGRAVSPEALAVAWRGLGQVVANRWLASLAVGGHEIIAFADGRGLVKGTAVVADAEALFERYVAGAGPGDGRR